MRRFRKVPLARPDSGKHAGSGSQGNLFRRPEILPDERKLHLGRAGGNRILPALRFK
jgi:hypothetical protein